MIGFWLLVTLGFSTRIPYLVVDDTVESFYLEGDPSIEFYHDFIEKFDSDEFFLVALKTDDVFSEPSLALIRDLTETLSAIPNVVDAVSLTNVKDIVAGDNDIEVAPLIGDQALTEAERQDRRRRASANPLIVGSIVSPDGTAAAVFCRVERIYNDSAFRKRITAQVRAVMKEKIPEGMTAFAAGGPIFHTVYVEHVQTDLHRFTPITIVLIAVLMMLIYRKWGTIWLPLVLISSSLVWIMGVLQLSGSTLSLVSNILPPLILVIGLAVFVHILNRYEEEYRKNGEKRQALIVTIRHLIWPCFLTSLTTAIGFGSLAISRIVPIRETGVLAAFGVMTTFAISITVGPAILSRLAPPAARTVVSHRNDPIDRLLALCTRWVIHRPWTVVVISALVTALGLSGILLLKVETNLIEYFRPESQVRQSYQFFEENISGANALELFLDGGKPDVFLEPANLRAMESVQRKLEQSPRITGSQSMADLVKMINRAFHNDDPAHYRIPDTRQEIAQLLLLLSMAEDRGGLDFFTDLNYSNARISSRMTTIPSSRLRKLVDDIEHYAASVFGPDIRAEATGEVVLYVDMEKELVHGQIKGFGIAIVIIILAVIALFRSVRVGLFSIYPNIAPILMTLGLMGVVGIPINLATCMLPSIAIGIAVDDTIHLLSRFRSEYKKRGWEDLPGAIREALATTGRAMVVTSVVLFCGFLVLVFSQFQPNMHFGILTAFTMIWALAADLLTVPALLVLLKPKRF